MSDPRVDYPDYLEGLRSELISVQSALNMKPEPLPGPFEEGEDYTSDRDRWVKHAYEHVCAALELVSKLESQRREQPSPVDPLRTEPSIIVNGVAMDYAQAMSIRVAVTDFHSTVSTAKARRDLGPIAYGYEERLLEVLKIMLREKP